jgi:hypothetical protein
MMGGGLPCPPGGFGGLPCFSPYALPVSPAQPAGPPASPATGPSAKPCANPAANGLPAGNTYQPVGYSSYADYYRTGLFNPYAVPTYSAPSYWYGY